MGAPATLMIIDDNEVDLLLSERIVARTSLFEDVITFRRACDACAHIVDHRKPEPDLILLDINMPEMNGFDFLEALMERCEGEFATPIVMLTTSQDPRDIARSTMFPIVRDFRSKPLSREMLADFRATYLS